MEDFKATIGRRIYLMRCELNYSRESLALKAGITSKFLYEIESGNKGMSAKTLCMLANALNTSLDSLTDGLLEGII
ncbi:MAG: helix-turn-helix domain-containing protein [Lachnospiraceae bacterium]|nr:helix-turn-helix domain-containing protein [Lachnospiraceae bacterium]